MTILEGHLLPYLSRLFSKEVFTNLHPSINQQSLLTYSVFQDWRENVEQNSQNSRPPCICILLSGGKYQGWGGSLLSIVHCNKNSKRRRIFCLSKEVKVRAKESGHILVLFDLSLITKVNVCLSFLLAIWISPLERFLVKNILGPFLYRVCPSWLLRRNHSHGIFWWVMRPVESSFLHTALRTGHWFPFCDSSDKYTSSFGMRYVFKKRAGVWGYMPSVLHF